MDYDNDGPERWTAAVTRGARLLDEALLTHDWREALVAADFERQALDYGIDLLDQLCRLDIGRGACREAIRPWALQAHNLSLVDLAMDYAPYEFEDVHRAWATYLTHCMAELVDAA